MRIGLLGPAEGDATLVREAAEFLLGKLGVDQVVYLGADDSARRAVEAWARELMGYAPTDESFFKRALALARSESPEQIDDFLSRDESVQRLSCVRGLPAAPTRAVELFEDKVVLLVHDKAQLDEEDIENSFLVVYGRSKGVALNHFGPRTFFSPGPLEDGQVAVIEHERDGSLSIARFTVRTGELIARTALETRRSKMVVLS